MRRAVDLESPAKKPKTPKIVKCPVCKSTNCVPIRSKRTRLVIVHDEKKLVTDKRWRDRGLVCLAGCGLLLTDADRQAEFDFDKKR